MSELSEGSEGSEVSELSEVSEETTACGRTHHSPQSEGQRPERLEGREHHTKQATSPVWEVRPGLWSGYIILVPLYPTSIHAYSILVL